MIIDSPIISGSQLSSAPLFQNGSVQITGSLSVSGSISGANFSGSVVSSSYATTSSYTLNSEFLDGLDSTSFVTTSSFEVFSSSIDTRVVNLESTASVLTTASSSFAAQSASLSTRVSNEEVTSSILTSASASFANQSASLSTRVTNNESTGSILTTASASFAVVSSSYASASGSLSTRVTNLESTSSTVSSSFASTSGSIAGRVTTIESKYATTGSNTFTGAQRITDVSNAIGFASTASLYTDGGLRVTKDSFVSGTAYFNNVVVYGTSSIEYITSSQLAIGTNIITLNTDTPAIRYGGISVFDSGSNNQSTGSLFWDSEKDKWIYSNPSGSTYDGGMLISGPRNTSGLGNEVGTTSCAVMIGQGGDHITSSGIFSYANATCFYGQSFISSSGAACFAGSLTGTNATFTGSVNVSGSLVITTTAPELTVSSTGVTLGNAITDLHQVTGSLRVTGSNTIFSVGCIGIGTATPTQRLDVAGKIRLTDDIQLDSANPTILWGSGTLRIYDNSSAAVRLTFQTNGAACFACELTAKTLGTNDLILNNLNYECANYVDGTRGSWLIQEGACDLFIINQVSGKKYKFNLIEIK